MKFVLAFLALALSSAIAVADHHKHVQGTDLEPKECYFLIAPMTVMYGWKNVPESAYINVPGGNVICVRSVEKVGDENWYRVLIMKMGTLDRSQHMPAWTRAEDLRVYGVMLSYQSVIE